MELKSLNKYFGIIGVFLFIFILSKVNWRETYEVVRRINFFWLSLSFLLLIFVTVIISLRWGYIVSKVGIKISKIDSILISFKSLFSEYSPGKTGYLVVTSVYLKDKTKKNWTKIIFATTFNKFIDMSITALEALIGVIILVFLFGIKSSTFIPIFIVLILIIASFILFMNNASMKFLSKTFFKIIIPKKYKENFDSKFSEFYENINNVGPKTILLASASQVISTLLSGISLYFLALAIGIELPLYIALIADPVIAIASILPISFSGLGTREAGIVFLFSLVNLPIESAIIFSLITFLFRNLLMLIGLILIPFDKKTHNPT